MRPALFRLLSRPGPLSRSALTGGARRLTLAACAALGLGLAAPAPLAFAQSPFAAALYVNDSPITNYEIDQKMRFLAFIGAAGDNPRERAIERLIEDRLQQQEADRLGGRLDLDQMDAGMAEFASRAELTTEEFLDRLAAEGIDRETFTSFIRAGLLWRSLIRQIYGPEVRITEAQIDQALSIEGVQPSTEVQISEIFLPTDPQFAEAVQRIVPQIQRITTETEFSNAARQVSAAPSGPSGGRVERWVNVTAIPAPVGEQMATAAIGTVIGPVEMPGALAFFQLRARRENRAVPPASVAIDYRRVVLPGGHDAANEALVAQIRAQVDSCVDLPGVVLRARPELPTEAVEVLSVRQTELNSAERTEIARLNPGEISSNIVQNGNLVLLMLCSRGVSEDLAPSRAQVRQALMNRALEGHAAIYLQRLRAEADIRPAR